MRSMPVSRKSTKKYLCPKCGGETTVLDVRRTEIAGGVRRRRECKSCRFRFRTYEIAINHKPKDLDKLMINFVTDCEEYMLKKRMDELISR